MRLCLLYHPVSEHGRQVESYAREFTTRYNKNPELISIETRDGADMARMYDVVQYPAVLVLADDGTLSKYWQGDMLPLMDEVAGYLHG